MMKKIISLILSIMLMVSFATVSYADANFTVAVDKNSVNIGDTVTITINSNDITCQNFNASVGWDKDNFTCTSITWIQDSDIGYQAKKGWISVSDVTKANNTGYVGWTGGGAENSEYAGGEMCTIVLTATAAGANTAITYTEDTTGTDAYKAAESTIATVTVVDPNAGGDDEPEAPVVEDPSTVEKSKTWNVVIDGGYVTADDTLTATLYDTTNEADKQDVVLSIGENVWGEAGWSFTLKANFNDENKMADIGLKVSK